MRSNQARTLNQVLNINRMKRLIEQEAFHGSAAYSLGEMLNDLNAGIWSELSSGSDTDVYRRNLQRAYLERMDELMTDEEAVQTDIVPHVRGRLRTLLETLKEWQQGSGVSENPTVLHYHDSIARIQAMLEPM